MANGYSGSSSASSASQNNTSSGGNQSYNEGFIKQKDGVKAPAGFHYMPNGRLMSDANHIALNGYIEKKINNFEFNLQDINHLGETRSFSIQGDGGSVFDLEVYDDSSTPNYYNFATKTWSTTKSGLYNIRIGGFYQFSINFPILGFVDATCDYNNDPTIDHDDDNGAIQAGMSVVGVGIPDGSTVSSVTSDTRFELSTSTTGGAVTNGSLRFSKLKTYTFDLFSKTVENIRTKHTNFIKVKNNDGTVNLNKSIGSDSNLLRKTLYQDVRKNLFLSCITPRFDTASADITDGEVSSSNRIVIDGRTDTFNNIKIGDIISGTGIAASSHVLVTKVNPDNDNAREFEVNRAVSIGDDVAITIGPAFKGLTPTDADTTNRKVVYASSGSSFEADFSITCTALSGRTLSSFKLPTEDDLCTYKTVTFGSAALAISGEDTSSASVFYRWPIDNIAGLSEGMFLDPSRTGTGTNTTTPAIISKYKTTKSSTELDTRRYYTDIVTTTLDDVFVPGVDSYGNNITAIDRNGVTTAQAGNITFDVQQVDALKADANVKIYAYGSNQIESLTGMSVKLRNVAITPTQISTTTTAAVSNSTTIPVTEMDNISTASTIRGVNINSAVANPTVTLKSAATGAGNLTASAAQTLENGQTLFFDNASNIITITGTISITNMSINDTTLYFDVERFLTSL